MSNPHPQQTYNQYKIRKLSWNKFGEVYGITIPREYAEKFKNVKFTISITKEEILLTSGLDLVNFKKEINNYGFDSI